MTETPLFTAGRQGLAAATSPVAMDPRKVGMMCFLCSEAAFFGTLLVAYAVYLGESRGGPLPADCLTLTTGLVGTVLLLSSSVTITFAVRGFGPTTPRGGARRRRFLSWLAATMLLGCLFLGNTAWEWYGLIVGRGLTLRTNLFGTTFFTLVGFHAGHVSIGIITMLLFFVLVARRRLPVEKALSTELFSWYWHFVDGVWIVILMLVYVFGR
jgi:cytochrome c oxidase subunit 3